MTRVGSGWAWLLANQPGRAAGPTLAITGVTLIDGTDGPSHGVLAVRDMGGDLDRLTAIREAIAAGTLAGPAIITPGPLVDGPQDASPAVSPVATPAEAAAAVHALAARRVDFIKVQAGLAAELWRRPRRPATGTWRSTRRSRMPAWPSPVPCIAPA